MKFEELCIENNLNKQFVDENGLIWKLINIDDYGMTLEDDNHKLISDEYSVLRIFTLEFKECKKPFIKYGCSYMYINEYYDVEFSYYYDDIDDNLRLEVGNIYPFNEDNKSEVYNEVKSIADKRKLQSKIEQFARENNDKINWEDKSQNKYYIYLDHDGNIVYTSYSAIFENFNSVYFTSLELLNEAIDKFGDEIKRLYCKGNDNE